MVWISLTSSSSVPVPYSRSSVLHMFGEWQRSSTLSLTNSRTMAAQPPAHVDHEPTTTGARISLEFLGFAHSWHSSLMSHTLNPHG